MIHLKPTPAHVWTNQRCPCPLGPAASNDFRCTADPSTFLPLKAFTNSSSQCTHRAKQSSQRSGVHAGHSQNRTDWPSSGVSRCKSLRNLHKEWHRKCIWGIRVCLSTLATKLRKIPSSVQQECQCSQKKAIWEYKGARYVIHTSPQCCGTELAQLTCCQSMKVIIPSETKCIIKMQILGALNGWWITCHIVMALISQPVIKVLG